MVVTPWLWCRCSFRMCANAGDLAQPHAGLARLRFPHQPAVELVDLGFLLFYFDSQSGLLTRVRYLIRKGREVESRLSRSSWPRR